MKAHFISLAIVSVLVSAACGGGDESKTAANVPSEPVAPPIASTSTALSTPPEPPAPPPEPPKPTMTDGDIGAITSAANNGEIEVAKVASKNCASAQVKTFATMMIKEHGDAETKGKKLLQTANITPSENEVSTKLKSDVEATVTSLKAQRGAECDKAYMDSQVKMHTDVLSALDDKLLPNAKNADLKTHLGEVRTHVASHLAKAQEISTSLSSGKSTTSTTTKTTPAKK